MQPTQKQSLSVPVAIIIAGLLVGGGIYLSGKGNGGTPVNNGGPTATNGKATEIKLRPLSSKDQVVGSLTSPIVLVEYSDTECPFCKTFHSTLQTIIGEYGKNGDVSWVYRHFPIAQLHSKAPKEAQAVECAADQGKFWQYLNALFAATPSNNGLDAAQLPVIAQSVGADVTSFNACLASTAHAAEISQSIADAQAAGANGTPSSFLILAKPLSDKTKEDITVATAYLKMSDGTPLVTIDKGNKIISMAGALPYDVVKGVIDIVLAK